MNYLTSARVDKILDDVVYEIGRSTELHGDQSHLPDGTNWARDRHYAVDAIAQCDIATEQGRLTWRHILTEEFAEALAESEPGPLRTELIQVASTAIKWVLAIDGRTTAIEAEMRDAA